MKEIGIYVHIPFCVKKCKYCDFISFENSFQNSEDYCKSVIRTIKDLDWVKSKIEEVKHISGEDLENFLIDTIYFGGGTPSSIKPELIVEILNTIKSSYNIKENCEITIEVNPGTVNKYQLEQYKNAGFNRISIGLQETHDEILSKIGRIHTYNQFLECFETAKNVGFDNINVDLMLALPNQTLEDLEESVKRIIALNPTHISLYSLILEEGTALEKEISSGKLKLPDEALERKMYHVTKKILEANGYIHYEISNFAKKGFESKHNSNCWNQKEYLGFGLAAHSYLDGVRFSNISDFSQYISNANSDPKNNIEINEIQDEQMQMKEYMMLGFRKLDGIKISEFEYRFGIHPLFYFRFEIAKLEEEGLIEVDLDNIRLTSKGLDLANVVFEEFI